MVKEGLKKILPVMQAFVEGKTIQRYDDKKNDWYDVSSNANIDFCYDYRIKPESKYRPFKNQEECCKEMLKHQPFGWIRSTMSGNWYVIESISDDIYYDGTFISYDVAFECCEFIDGTPFGVKI